MLNKYEQTLLMGWEDLHKKGQLSMWILLTLKDGPKPMADIKKFINKAIQGRLETDDKSMYRALRRFAKAEMIEFSHAPSKVGPQFKVYKLSQIGQNVLQTFLRRNIISIFYNEQLKQLIIKEEYATE